jgi:NTE family protein
VPEHLGEQRWPHHPEIGLPTGRWIGQTFRTLYLVQQQSENSRKRILFGVHNLGQRKVAYWSLDTPIAAYALADSLALAPEAVASAAGIRTRLNPFSLQEMDLLLRCGYAGADASLRKYGFAFNKPEASFDCLATLL